MDNEIKFQSGAVLFGIGDEVRWRRGLDWLRGRIHDISLARDKTVTVGVLCESGAVVDVLDPEHDLRKSKPHNTVTDADVGCGNNPRMARWYKPDCGACWDCSSKARAAGDDATADLIHAERRRLQDEEFAAGGVS